MENNKAKRLLTLTMALAFVMSSVGIMPTAVNAASAKTVTVKTQKQLDAALKEKQVTSIVIKTSKNVTIQIKDGDYSKKNLAIAAPKATINNYGDFKKISINDGKTIYERGVDNYIVVNDKNTLKLTTTKQSANTRVTVSGKGGKVNIVDNGKVKAINIKGKSSVTVSGNAKEAPTITNNAAGANISTYMDANVVLNKSATLTVKGNAELGSVKVNAASNISVAASASVDVVDVKGRTSKLYLTVNGTVKNVTVDAKAEVAVSGKTTDTVEITNNAEGASVQASVKVDVTLNKAANVILDKGAEGSSVKIADLDVKPVVKNNTVDKVTVTDSNGKETIVESGKDTESTTPTTPTTPDTGNTGGGSSGGGYYPPSSGGSGNSGMQTVTITPNFTMMDGATVLKPGVVLKASATNSANADVTYSYQWICGEESVGTSDTYTVSEKDSSKTITLTVTAEINGSIVSASKTIGTVETINYQYAFNVPFGTSADDVKNHLDTLIEKEYGETIEGKVTWISYDYKKDTAGTYFFTGKIAIQNEAVTTVDVKVTVLEEGALLFSYEKYPVPAGTGGDQAPVSNQNLISVENSAGSYDCYVHVNAKELTSYKLNDLDGQWIGVNIIVTKLPIALKLQYSLDQSNWKNISEIVASKEDTSENDTPEEVASEKYVIEATDKVNVFTVWLAADQLKEEKDFCKVIYFRYYQDGDTPVVATPVTFHLVQGEDKVAM